ncbi:MAG: lysostaphin resistance A-like protein [Candidatus Promineifilaceae bacterium]|jgi:membrane protease YdiL (CAAX protease family)
MSILIPLALVLILTLAANKVAVSENPETKKTFTWLLVFLNSVLSLLSLGILFLPGEAFLQLLDSNIGQGDVQVIALILLATGLWGIFVCWLPFRSLLAKFIAVDVNSPVHLTALVLVGYLVGNTALSLSQDLLQQLDITELTVSVIDVVLQQTGFVLLALTGAGLFIRRDLAGVYNRLGLDRPTFGQLLMGSGLILVLIIIQATIGGIWALLDPEQAAQLGSLNEALLAGFDSIDKWFILALASGIGEEMLFRGALQPVFGLPLTSLLFAIVHIQYGLTPITFVVFFLGLILGLVRKYSSTTVAIFVHFGYNFSLGLLTLLALYLEQFVTT